MTPPAAESIVRPPFRVVFSMSTLPHQVEYVNETLTSLAQQALKPDAIYINLPYINRRTNTAYVAAHVPHHRLVAGRATAHQPRRGSSAR